MRKIVLFFALILVISSTFAKVISLEEAKKSALLNNPEYLSKKFAYQAAKWSAVKSFSALFPSAKISASQMQMKPGTPQFSSGGMPVSSDVLNTRSYGFSVNQPLFLGGKIWLGYKISSDSKKMAKYDFLNQKLKTTAAAEEKYLSCLETRDLLEISQQQLRLATENLKTAKIKFQAGTISKTELLKFQADEAAKESELIRARRLQQISDTDLKNFLQLSEPIEVEEIPENAFRDLIEMLNGFSQDEIERLTLKIITVGKQNNFSLKALKQTKKIASRSVSMASGNFLPTLNLNFSDTWSKNWDENQTPSNSDYNDTKQLLLSASIPIFPLTDNFAALKKAKYDLKKTENDFISVKSGIETALEKVRSAALVMKQPKDMVEVCRIISDQLEQLNLTDIRNIQTAIIDEQKGTYLNYEYFSQYKTTSILEIETKLHPAVEEFAQQITKSKDAFFTKTFEGEALKKWIRYRKETHQNEDPILEKSDSVHYYFYSIGPGALGISTYEPMKEEDIAVFEAIKPILDGGIIYHCGPVVSGVDTGDYKFVAAGPTTSIREEPYQALVMKLFNLKGVIGKGGMEAKTLQGCMDTPAVYFHAIGGAASLIAQSVQEVIAVHKLDFGVPEAMWVIDVKDFPVVVTMDSHGRSQHVTVYEKSKKVLDELMAK